MVLFEPAAESLDGWQFGVWPGEVPVEEPECFTPDEWAQWYFMAGQANWWAKTEQGYDSHIDTDEWKEQARRTVCDDCTVAFQVRNVLQGTCRPAEGAVTPIEVYLQGEQQGLFEL